MAAHGWVSGAAALETGPLTLLVAASAAVGALVSGVSLLRTTWLGLVTALIGGQMLGHFSMMWGSPSGHHHHNQAAMWSPAMLAAHCTAAVAAAVVIVGAEAAYRITTTVLSWALPIPVSLPVPSGFQALPIAHRDRVVLRIFAADVFRTRGPPALVRG